MQASPLEKFQVERVAHFVYDFAKHGGAVGAITLTDDVIPDDALITRGAVHVKTACTSDGSATVALSVNSANDVMGTTAGAVANLSLAANIVVVPVPQTAATWIKTTAKKNLTFTIAVAALKTGKVEIFLAYFMGM